MIRHDDKTYILRYRTAVYLVVYSINQQRRSTLFSAVGGVRYHTPCPDFKGLEQ